MFTDTLYLTPLIWGCNSWNFQWRLSLEKLEWWLDQKMKKVWQLFRRNTGNEETDTQIYGQTDITHRDRVSVRDAHEKKTDRRISMKFSKWISFFGTASNWLAFWEFSESQTATLCRENTYFISTPPWYRHVLLCYDCIDGATKRLLGKVLRSIRVL